MSRLKDFAKAALAAAALYVIWNAAAAAFGGGCVLKAMTGLPCPGCGMVRAVVFLLKGQFAAAFAMHPAVYLLPVAAALAIAFKGRARYAVIAAFCAVLVAVYIYRMVAVFPHSAPLDFESAALIPRIVRFFTK